MASLDKPLSEAAPTALDEKLSAELEARLHLENVFEPPEECARREEVLGEINEALQEWARSASAALGIEEDLNPRCNLYTFGSYRLGVHGPAADIDTLCIGPRHLQRAAPTPAPAARAAARSPPRRRRARRPRRPRRPRRRRRPRVARRPRAAPLRA